MSLLTRLLGIQERESVYFFTLHKCASTLFSGYALKHLVGLRQVNHARRIYRGKTNHVSFEKQGRVHGPIRLSAMRESPGYAALVAPLLIDGVMDDKIALFMIRDPRDILVSAYHSFGFTHGFSPVPIIRRLQEARRVEIRTMTLDEYVMKEVPEIKRAFGLVASLHRACPRSVILKYEDMIEDWNHFASQLTRFVAMRPRHLRRLHELSRPRPGIRAESHRRDGRAGQHVRSLLPETVARLDRELAPELAQFGYPSATN